MRNVIERVLNLLIYLLESPRPVTADDIRYTVQGYGDQSDEAFHRMFERDKGILRRLGVPLELEHMDAWEVEQGYRVDPKRYALADPGLSAEEKAALSLAARMVRVGGSYLGLDALLKLGGVERGGGLEPMGADLGANASSLGDLFAAVSERRKIQFNYRGHQRSVEPYGIAHRRGHWYLAGRTSDGERVYRVDRIEGLEVAEETDSFTRPKGFDLRRVVEGHPWEEGLGHEVRAKVSFDPEVAWWAARTLGIPEPAEGLHLVAEVPVINTDAFIGWVLSFGDAAEIVSPPEMRHEVVRKVNAALEAVR